MFSLLYLVWRFGSKTQWKILEWKTIFLFSFSNKCAFVPPLTSAQSLGASNCGGITWAFIHEKCQKNTRYWTLMSVHLGVRLSKLPNCLPVYASLLACDSSACCSTFFEWHFALVIWISCSLLLGSIHLATRPDPSAQVKGRLPATSNRRSIPVVQPGFRRLGHDNRAPASSTFVLRGLIAPLWGHFVPYDTCSLNPPLRCC